MAAPRTMRKLGIMLVVCSVLTIGGFAVDYLRKGEALASAPMVFLGGFFAGSALTGGLDLLMPRKILER
jgi:hypothetical protein